ncbi:Peptidase M13, partial [Lobulomyces angularis]
MFRNRSRSRSPVRENYDELIPFQDLNRDTSENYDADDTEQLNGNTAKNNKFVESKKRISLAVFITLIIIIIFTILIISKSSSSSNQTYSKDDVCLTESCVIRASTILKSLDSNVNPCEDFYAFSCNNWKKEFPVTEDVVKRSAFTYIQEKTKLKVKTILESDYPIELDRNLTNDELSFDKNLFRNIKNFYESCLNKPKIDSVGLSEMLQLIKKLISFWTEQEVTEPNFKEKFTEVLAALHNLGIYVLFHQGVSVDSKNSDQYVIRISPSRFYLPTKDYYNVEKFTSVYKKNLETFFKLILPNIPDIKKNNSEEATAAAENVVAFETELSKYTLKREEIKSPAERYNVYLLEDLKNLTDFISWELYFEKLYPQEELKKFINKNTRIIVEQPKYMMGLDTVLKSASIEATQLEFLWNISFYFFEVLPDNVKDTFKELNEALGYQGKKPPPRFESCLSLLQDIGAGEAVSGWFLLDYFPPGSKEEASKLIEYIKQSYTLRFPLVEWFDSSTMSEALKKIEKLKSKVGYPEYIKSPKELEKVYKVNEFGPFEKDSLFKNYLVALNYMSNKEKRLLLKSVDKNEWAMIPLEVNAYYSPNFNEIVFPAGILQPPFYSASDPDYLSFGSYGFIIGHELSHAFDSSGKMYNAEGELKEWWSPNSVLEYDKRKSCFIEQFNNYKMEINQQNYSMNGQLTLNENLADSAGIARAWESWQLKVKNENNFNKVNFGLPGLLKYTPEQLFFISFGNLWCTNSNEESLINQIENDVHAVTKFRVNGALSNSENFSKAFKCAKNSKMNPE